MRKKLALAAVALFTVAIPAMAMTGADDVQRYKMHLAMYDGDQKVAEPVLVVAAGESSRIEIEPGNGAYYRATVSLSPSADNKISFQSDFDVSSSTIGVQKAKPFLTLGSGELGRIEFGNQSDVQKPFRVDVTVDTLTN